MLEPDGLLSVCSRSLMWLSVCCVQSSKGHAIGFRWQTVFYLQDVADAIAQMHEKARYRQLLFFLETCEAEPMTRRIYSRNVMTVATSKLGEM